MSSEREPIPGKAILRTGWVANALFAVTAVPAAVTRDDTLLDIAIATSLALFLFACGAFLYAFGVGIARTAKGDNVAVANLFFLQGSAPRRVQHEFLAMFAVCLAIALATMVWEPFGVLVPMLPPGLAGVWAARHGTFGPRATRAR